MRKFEASGWKYRAGKEKDFLSVLVGSPGQYITAASDRFEYSPEYRFSVSSALYSQGLTPEDIFSNIALGTEGRVVAQLENGGRAVDVRLRYGRTFVDSAEKAASLLYKEKDNIVFTRPLIEVNKRESSGKLTRVDRHPDNGDSSASDPILKSNLKDIFVLFAGAIVFVWFVLAIQFESLLIPFIILGTVPLGVAGSFIALYLTGRSLNISSFLGLMILTGTAVNSGILIMSDIQEGSTLNNASCSRLRTVVLSVFSTVSALLPVAFLDTNPIQSSASISLLGGLVIGTVTLFALIPFFSKEDFS